MTTESQKAREKWYESIQRGKTINPDMAFCAGWQASEARIRAMLESEEMIKLVGAAIAEAMAYDPELNAFKFKREAKAVLKAIAEEI